MGGYKPDHHLYNNDTNHAIRKQKHLRAVSEANLLDMEHHHRPRSRGPTQRRSRSRSRLEDHEDDLDDPQAANPGANAGDLINGAFVNHAMDEIMDHRAGRLGGGRKAIAASQISIASRYVIKIIFIKGDSIRLY